MKKEQKNWKQHEIKKMINLHENGYNYNEILIELNRSYNSVRAKLMRI